MRRIAVFTATRAEYGLLRPVLQRLRAMDECDLRLLVSGTHLSVEHGLTLNEIVGDGFNADYTIPMSLQGKGSGQALCHVLGLFLSQLGETLARCNPDLLVLLGDRYECLGAAMAASMTGVPVAHLYGGEITQGAMDDNFRHAVTKLSHLHFTSCEPYRRRVIQLGEQPDRVWNVGSLGVENALSVPPLTESALRAFLGVGHDKPYFLCTFHPVTLEAGTEETQLQELFAALDGFPDIDVVFTGANADPGGGRINRLLREFAGHRQARVHLFDSLGVVRYLSAARYAACVLGNSSSGVVEIPSLKVPVVDIGDRQLGRLRSDAVLHCPPERRDIRDAISLALSPEQAARVKTAQNPYEKSGTSATIVEKLLSYPLDGILTKKFYDVPR